MVKYTLIVIFILISPYALPNTEELVTSQTIIRNGVGLGSVLAVVLSWDRNNSILLAIIHGIFSWLYVIYYALTR